MTTKQKYDDINLVDVSIGPFRLGGISQPRSTIAYHGSMYEVISPKIKGKLDSLGLRLHMGTTTPLAKLNLSRSSKIRIGINIGVVKFCWAYPITDISSVSLDVLRKTFPHNCNLSKMLISGAFLYFDEGGCMVGIKVIYPGTDLYFDGPYVVENDRLDDLAEVVGRNQLHEVTNYSLKEKGMEKYGWIEPGIFSVGGSFLYKLENGHFVTYDLVDSSKISIIPEPSSSLVQPNGTNLDSFDIVSRTSSPPVQYRFDRPVIEVSIDQESPKDGAKEKFVCLVCMVEIRSTVFLPCGHIVCCEECSHTMKTGGNSCPICRSKINSTHKVYL